MGLYAEMDTHIWGFPDMTPQLGLPISYSGVGELFAERAQSIATADCPVDTGYLQSTIEGAGSGTTATIQAGAEYAQYLEYGTWKMSAQPYFTYAVEQAASEAFELATTLYEKALKEEEAIIRMIEEMERMMRSLSSSFGGGGGGGRRGRRGRGPGSLTESVGGVTFKRDGSLKSGMNYMMTRPGMWRQNTSFYNTAVTRSANLESSRSIAMSRFSGGGSGSSSFRSGGGGGGGSFRSGGGRSYSSSFSRNNNTGNPAFVVPDVIII